MGNRITQPQPVPPPQPFGPFHGYEFCDECLVAKLNSETMAYYKGQWMCPQCYVSRVKIWYVRSVQMLWRSRKRRRGNSIRKLTGMIDAMDFNVLVPEPLASMSVSLMYRERRRVLDTYVELSTRPNHKAIWYLTKRVVGRSIIPWPGEFWTEPGTGIERFVFTSPLGK